jgi:hypothetical protein
LTSLAKKNPRDLHKATEQSKQNRANTSFTIYQTSQPFHELKLLNLGLKRTCKKNTNKYDNHLKHAVSTIIKIDIINKVKTKTNIVEENQWSKPLA